MSPRPIVCALVCSAIAVAMSSCGGNESGGESISRATATGQTASTAIAATTMTETQDETPIAEAALLRLSDFPEGWAENDFEESEESPCEAVRRVREMAAGRARSGDFSNGQSTRVHSQAAIFTDDTLASDVFGDLASDETRKCLADALRDRLEDNGDLEWDDPQIGRFNAAAIGDESTAVRIQARGEANGLGVTAYIDAVYIRIGRGIANVLFADMRSPFDSELRQQLSDRAAERLASALEQTA